jgi:hypothetical protein
MSEKKIFIGGGFTDSQIIWTLLIVDGFCSKKNIKNIIFENKIPDYILHNKTFSKVLAKYKIDYLKYNIFFKKLYIFECIIFFLLNLKKIFYLLFFFKRNDLLKINNWYDIQIYHGFWDLGYRLSKDGYLNLSFKTKLISSIKIFANLYLAKKLYKLNIFAAFMGHAVYGSRAMIAVFRKKNIRVYIQSLYRFNLMHKKHDDPFYFLKNNLKNLKNNITYKIYNQYWIDRLCGNSNYDDSNIARYPNVSIKYKNNLIYDNVIMLHVFRDSPFFILDQKRIFSDYIDWIVNTLIILKETNEQWIIRPHPSRKLWGEDSSKFFFKIYNQVFRDCKNKNIIFDHSKTSNLKIFTIAKRIVTYSGTAQIESACFGIKPIFISDSSITNMSQSLFLKPKTILEYKELLLINSRNKCFKLNDKEIDYAKFVLYLNEKFFSIKEALGLKHEYNNTKIDDLYKNIFLKKIIKKYQFLNKSGQQLNKNYSMSVAEEFLKSVYK